MEHRQVQRTAAYCNAEVRCRNGGRIELKVLDISLGGCMVEARGWTIRAGEKVSVRLPGLSFLPAEVIWHEDERAGIALEELLYEPTLEYIRSQMQQAA